MPGSSSSIPQDRRRALGPDGGALPVVRLRGLLYTVSSTSTTVAAGKRRHLRTMILSSIGQQPMLPESAFFRILLGVSVKRLIEEASVAAASASNRTRMHRVSRREADQRLYADPDHTYRALRSMPELSRRAR